MTFNGQLETIRGIPEEKWMHRDLMDIARMTDKQRHAYWVSVSTAQAHLLITKGNCVGEKPDRPLNITQMVKEHEDAHQRAMAYQRQIVDEDERNA